MDARRADPARLLPRPPVGRPAARPARRRRSSAQRHRRAVAHAVGVLGAPVPPRLELHPPARGRRCATASASTGSCGAATSRTSRGAGRTRATHLRLAFAGVPEDEVRAMVGGNAAERLRLRLDAARRRWPTSSAHRRPRSPSRSPPTTSPTRRCGARRSPLPGSSATSPSHRPTWNPQEHRRCRPRAHRARQFNPLAEGFVEWPYDQYRRLRAEDPIHRSELLHGYCVTRFADVNTMLARLRRSRREIDNADAHPAHDRRDPRRRRGSAREAAPLVLLDDPDHAPAPQARS